MNAVSVQTAMKDLPELIDRTIKNTDEMVIVSDAGSVVVIDQNEWESIQETLRLLRDSRSLKALLESHKLRAEGKKIESKSIEEAFFDLQG